MKIMKAQLCLYCVLLVLVTSCATVLASRYDYNLEVRNIGTERISECEVTSEKGFKQRLGLLVPKAGDTTLGPFKYPYADRWTITWKTAKGEKLTKTLDLTKAFPKPFKGRLVLTIDSDNNLAHFTEKYYAK